MHIKFYEYFQLGVGGKWRMTSNWTSMLETENDIKLLIGNFLRGIHSVLPAVKTWFGLHYTAICKNYCGINNVNREFTSCNIASLSFRLYYLWYYTWRSVQICKHIAMVSIPWPRICSTHCNGQHSLTSSGMLPWKQDVKKYNLVYHWITLYSRQSHNYTSDIQQNRKIYRTLNFFLSSSPIPDIAEWTDQSLRNLLHWV